MEQTPINILIVEDNLAHLKLTRLVLQRTGTPARIGVVRDGQEALDYLFRTGGFTDASRHPRPDLILLDLNLPKRDGREVLKIVKRDPDLSSIPVVIVSTSDREEDVAYAFQHGAAAYISKSIGFTAFSRELESALVYARPGAGAA